MCFRRKAKRVPSKIPLSNQEDVATLSEFLPRQFNPSNRENAFCFVLLQCKKFAKESLMEYGGEVLHLTQKACPVLQHEATVVSLA